MSEPKTRLAAIIEATGLTQAAFAARAGLSTAYIKKLKASGGDNRHMSKKAAVAIAVAFGVDYNWLLGNGSESPIPARFGRQWTKETADCIENRKMSTEARAEDAVHCIQWFVINTDRLARIIEKGFKTKKAILCLNRIDSAISDLMKEFKVLPTPPKFSYAEWCNRGKWNTEKSPQIIAGKIAANLVHGLDNVVAGTPEPLSNKQK